MGFQKGNKMGKGRPAGSPNKITTELRGAIGQFLTDNFDKVQDTWDKANEREMLQFYVQLLRFAVPQLQTVEMVSDFERITELDINPLIVAALGQGAVVADVRIRLDA